MDLALWKQVESSGKLRPEEFFAPERMSGRLVQGLGLTREATGRMMRMSRTADGRTIFHPNGDANEFGDGHASFSLHYFGIDHDASKREGVAVEDTTQYGLACDFDFAATDPNFLFELYLKLERVRFPFAPYRWTGIGAYAHWRLGRKANPGFHVDLRSLEHPNLDARWMREAGGKYVPLTWKAWKKEFRLEVTVSVQKPTVA